MYDLSMYRVYVKEFLDWELAWNEAESPGHIAIFQLIRKTTSEESFIT